MLERNKWLMYPGLLFIALSFIRSFSPSLSANWTSAVAYSFVAQMFGGVAVVVATGWKRKVSFRDTTLRFGYALMSALAAALITGGFAYVTGELHGYIYRLFQELYVVVSTVLFFASAIAATRLRHPLVACWQSVRYMLSRDGFQLFAMISGVMVMLFLGLGLIITVLGAFGVSRHLGRSPLPVIIALVMVAMMQVIAGIAIWSRFGCENDHCVPAADEII